MKKCVKLVISKNLKDSLLLRNNSIMIIMEISWGFTTGNDFFIRRVSYIGDFFFSFRPLARYVVEILYRLRNDV